MFFQVQTFHFLSVRHDFLFRFSFQKFERSYHDSLTKGTVTHTVQFEYAWCLIRSKFGTDVKRGIYLLEDLSKSGNESGRRDCIYYLAIGNAKIKVRHSTTKPGLQLILWFYFYKGVQQSVRLYQSPVTSRTRKQTSPSIKTGYRKEDGERYYL